MTEQAKRDENYVTGLMGVSNADGVTPLRIYVDAATHAMLVSASITLAAGASVSQADNSAFTASTTSANVVAGFYHSTIDAVTDGRAAALAIDSKRNLFVVIRDAAGNARGINVDANNNLGAVLAAETTKVIGTVNIAAGQTIAATLASGAVASGAISSGAIASGAIASGAIASGAIASGAVASGAFAAGSIAAGAVAAGASSFVKLEDVASADADAGVPAMAVRKATPANTSGTDGDYEMLQMSAGRLWTSASIDTALPAGTALIGKVGIDQTTPGTTNAVSLAQIGATTVVTGGVAGTLAVGGNVATNVAIGTNPINNGAQAVSSENTAVTTARMVQLVADLVGKLIVLPYSNPENFVSGVTAAITDTTGTSIIASAGGSLRNYITHILVTNSHATVSSLVEIRDGTTTVLYRGYALAAGGGFSATLPVPLRGSAATAVNAYVITTGSNIYVSASGYKGV